MNRAGEPALDRPWRDHLAWVRAVLRGAVASPDAEARWLVEEASGYDAAEWIGATGAVPPPRALEHLHAMVARRLRGEPLQYVLGGWRFRTLDLMLDRRVLIPRPETEMVVEVVLTEAERQGIRRRRHRRPAPPPEGPVAVDLGTGSGAIALSLAAELVVNVWATDRSPDALDVARANAAGNALAGVSFAEGSWFAALPADLRGRCAVVVSNPPYVAQGEVAFLPREIREHEPLGALVAGPTGTEALEHIVAGAGEWLSPGGALVLELAPHHAGAVLAAAHAAGYVDLAVHDDLSGRSRALVARRSPGAAAP